MRVFLTNPKKMIFISKTSMIIVLGIDFLVDNNSHAIIPLFSFFCGAIVFYSLFLENIFISKKNFIQLFNYYMSMIYMLSGFFVLFGHIMKKKERNNYFFVFIIINLIMFLILYFWVFRIKIINFKDEIQFLNEFEIYLHTKSLLESIEHKSNDREIIMNYLQYQTYHSSYFNKELNEEDRKYNFYLIIEKILKKRMVLFKNSLLLKLMHFIILKNYLKNNKSAYLILYHLYYDIDNKLFSANFSQFFFIFKLKKSIEDDSIEFNFNKNNISIRYQVNTLMDLISNISEQYYSFWNLLLSSIQKKEIKQINKIGRKIHQLIQQIDSKFKEIENTKYKNSKIFLLYGYYLRDILNDKEKAEKYINDEFIPKIEEKPKYNNKSDYIETPNLQFLIISIKKNYMIFERVTKDFCIHLGYLPEELIGKNINIIFPEILKKEYENEFKKNLQNLHFKKEKKDFYFKTKGKFLLIFPMNISLEFDEEHNYYLLCELIINQFVILNTKTTDKICHIITDVNCYISLFSSNSIILLELNSKFISSTIDLTLFITEFQEEINQASLKNKNNDMKKIKIKILREKYLNHEKEINWNLNDKYFKIKCKEIFINGKLQGYYFYMSKININKKELSIIKNNNDITLDLLPNKKKDFQRAKTVRKISKDIVKESLIYEKIFIDDEFIPGLEKEVSFFPESKEYLFINKENKKSQDSIIDYINKNEINKKKRKKSNNSKKISQMKTFSENTSKDSSNLSSSDLSDDDDDDEDKNISENNVETFDNFDNEEEQNELDFFKTSPVHLDKCYFINFENISFYIYDYEKHLPVEVKDYDKKSQIELIINDESNNKDNIFPSLSIIKKTTLKKVLKKNENLSDKNKKKKIEQSEEITFEKSNLNIFIFIWIIIVLLNFIGFLIISFFFFSFCESLRNKIIQTIRIHNSISDIMEDSNKAFYYSCHIITFKNTLYMNLHTSKIVLENLFKQYLNQIFKNLIERCKQINIYSIHASSKNKFKIDNYTLKLVSLSSNLKRNTSISKAMNLIEEFSFSIYYFINLDEKDFLLSNKYFNFILANYESLLYNDLKGFSDIFMDESYNLIDEFYLIIIICFIFFFLIYIISFLLQCYIISRIYDEQEKATNIFFKINPDYIINAIQNCENFIELHQKDKTNPEYLVSNPIINLSQEDVNDISSNNSILETKSLIRRSVQFDLKKKKKTLIKQSESNICSKKKIYNSYIIIFNILILILLMNLLYIIIIQITKYRYTFNLSNIYVLILRQKTFLINNYNYIRIMICYYPYRYNKGQINDIYIYLQSYLKMSFETNQNMFTDIMDQIHYLKSEELNLFNKLMNSDICQYIDDYMTKNNLTCDDFADGIGHYGLISSSIYAFQLILYIENNLENIIHKGQEKGFYYNEIIYRSDIINELYPNDTSLWDEYQKLNPFLVLNDEHYHALMLLIEQLIQSASYYLTNNFKSKMIDIIEDIKIQIIACEISFFIILIITIYFFLLPRILRKNEEITEEKNMLKIIPKNELEQLLIKENIKI